MKDMRVLIVDDEQSVLSALERNLSDTFQVTCSCSSTEAVEILQQSSEFAVVVTDMRMPDVNGIQFIQQARAVSPDTLYIMLTGNQDLKTVVQATNDGRVFRYFTKPCPIEDLTMGIQAAMDKYGETVNDRELLKSTFAGVFDVMLELLTASHPVISAISERVKALTSMACKELNWPSSWEATIAGRMSMIGFTVLPEKLSNDLVDVGIPYSTDMFATLERGFKTSQQLMVKIPRLGRVCEVIEAMYGAEASAEVDQCSYGQLLGMTTVYVIASRKSESNPAAAVSASFPTASAEMLNAIQSANEKFLAECQQATKVTVKQLEAGMVLADDVLTDGAPVLRRGDVITDRLREHLGTLGSLPNQVLAFVPS